MIAVFLYIYCILVISKLYHIYYLLNPRYAYLNYMAIPSLYTFNQLPVNARIGLVVFEGAYLATRMGGGGRLREPLPHGQLLCRGVLRCRAKPHARLQNVREYDPIRTLHEPY